MNPFTRRLAIEVADLYATKGFTTEIEGFSRSSASGTAAAAIPYEFVVVQRTDFSAVFGGGVEIPAGAVTFTVATRYTMGLQQVSDVSDAHNRALSFYVGVSR